MLFKRWLLWKYTAQSKSLLACHYLRGRGIEAVSQTLDMHNKKICSLCHVSITLIDINRLWMCSSGRDVMFKFLIKLKPKRARAHLQQLMLSYIIFQSLIFKMPKQLDLISSNYWSFLCFYILAVKSYILRCILLKLLSLGTSPSLTHKQMGPFFPFAMLTGYQMHKYMVRLVSFFPCCPLQDTTLMLRKENRLVFFLVSKQVISLSFNLYLSFFPFLKIG